MKPLVGVWVHQTPELGNVVYVMPGFLSVVGCRIIPQEVGPLGIQEGRVMWSPVFEIICGFDGSNKFFLHGSDGEDFFLYPGSVTGIEKSCNVLLLEVEPRREKSLCSEEEVSRKVSFWDLSFSDKSDLLELVTTHVGLHVPQPLTVKLFPTLKDDENMLESRAMLLKMHKFGGNWKDMNLEEEEEQLCYNPRQVDIAERWEHLSTKIFPYEENRENRQSFLNGGDTFGLSLKASYIETSSYLGWPNMSLNHFSLYKLPIKNPLNDQVYAGLWGGTYGWPPGKCIEDHEGKTDKALYLVMLTYEQSQEDRDKTLLIGTKILEGTDYVMYPNGSTMISVGIDTASSLEPFPFDGRREFEHSYKGGVISLEGGYGFRCPGWKPGSLFVISNDLLAFVCRETETRDVLTLQRLNLEEILKKGLGLYVPPLPPTMNFTFWDRSYTNVFAKSYDLHQSRKWDTLPQI